MTEAEYKRAFIKKHHKADWSVETSGMDQYGGYVKTYIFTDGAQMTQVNRPVWETVEAEVETKCGKVTISKDIKMMETELWNTDDATSVKFYELW